MKRLSAIIAVLLLAVVTAASAHPNAGVRLHNQDGRAYKLYVRHSGSAVHTSIGPSTVTNICSAACSIRIEDTGASVDASPGESIVIKGGRLVKR